MVETKVKVVCVYVTPQFGAVWSVVRWKVSDELGVVRKGDHITVVCDSTLVYYACVTGYDRKDEGRRSDCDMGESVYQPSVKGILYSKAVVILDADVFQLFWKHLDDLRRALLRETWGRFHCISSVFFFQVTF